VAIRSASSSDPRVDPGRPSPDEFRAIIGRFASGVTVITTRSHGVARGATASAVSSLSLEPPMLIACLNRRSQTAQAIVERGRFAVNILNAGQIDVAAAFARSSGTDKFRGVSTHESPRGIPLLTDALATVECRVASAAIGGTHHVFLGEVERATARDGAPLAYFNGQMGRFSHATDDAVTAHLRRIGRARAARP
jgi:flavin reductase (DIM6/NTAB) family NADH-FMN oxidoreductase RutF